MSRYPQNEPNLKMQKESIVMPACLKKNEEAEGNIWLSGLGKSKGTRGHITPKVTQSYVVCSPY